MVSFDELTVEEYRRMKHDEGMTDKQIADSLFIGTATLSRWKKRNDVTAGRSVEDYIQLREQGYRDFQILAKWNITFSALYQWKAKRGLVGKEIAHG